VKLTEEGWQQAHAAGRKLRDLLRPDDTLQIYTSPYRRTRETTEGILETLTSNDPSPSPFPRHTIKVYEEPRLREQDFGNFQPDSAAMARMWAERAAYGHFFYRIPNGESAADAYDRVSGFNESLWRSFEDKDFPSVCVLVTHGLMTRVFLMKWYHFSVDYFEDLRNMNHCEFVVMARNESGKYVLRNHLRTWTEYRAEKGLSGSHSPIPVRRRWEGCRDEPEGSIIGRQPRRQNTADLFADDWEESMERLEELTRRRPGTPRGFERERGTGENDRNGEQAGEGGDEPAVGTLVLQEIALGGSGTVGNSRGEDGGKQNSRGVSPNPSKTLSNLGRLEYLQKGRDGGGSRSGDVSPYMSDEGEDVTEMHPSEKSSSNAFGMHHPRSMAMALRGTLIAKSGMNLDARADALGDQSDIDDDQDVMDAVEAADKSFAGSVR
jgi:broad specificity phosphatase PhoE